MGRVCWTYNIGFNFKCTEIAILLKVHQMFCCHDASLKLIHYFCLALKKKNQHKSMLNTALLSILYGLWFEASQDNRCKNSEKWQHPSTLLCFSYKYTSHHVKCGFTKTSLKENGIVMLNNSNIASVRCLVKAMQKWLTICVRLHRVTKVHSDHPVSLFCFTELTEAELERAEAGPAFWNLILEEWGRKKKEKKKTGFRGSVALRLAMNLPKVMFCDYNEGKAVWHKLMRVK